MFYYYHPHFWILTYNNRNNNKSSIKNVILLNHDYIVKTCQIMMSCHIWPSLHSISCRIIQPEVQSANGWRYLTMVNMWYTVFAILIDLHFDSINTKTICLQHDLINHFKCNLNYHVIWNNLTRNVIWHRRS